MKQEMKPSHTDLSRVNRIAGIPIHVFPNPVIPPLNPASPLPLTTLPTPPFLGVSFNASPSAPSCLRKGPQAGPLGDWDQGVQLPCPPPGPLPRRMWIPSLDDKVRTPVLLTGSRERGPRRGCGEVGRLSRGVRTQGGRAWGRRGAGDLTISG